MCFLHNDVRFGTQDETLPRKLKEVISLLRTLPAPDAKEFKTLNLLNPASYLLPQVGEVSRATRGLPSSGNSRGSRISPVNPSETNSDVFRFTSEEHQGQVPVPLQQHPFLPATSVQEGQTSGSRVYEDPEIAVEDLPCCFKILADPNRNPITPYECGHSLPFDMKKVVSHMLWHSGRDELLRNPGECPFPVLDGESPCSTKLGYEDAKSDPRSWARHLYTKHFKNAPRVPCLYCGHTFKRQSEVTRHQKGQGVKMCHVLAAAYKGLS